MSRGGGHGGGGEHGGFGGGHGGGMYEIRGVYNANNGALGAYGQQQGIPGGMNPVAFQPNPEMMGAQQAHAHSVYTDPNSGAGRGSFSFSDLFRGGHGLLFAVIGGVLGLLSGDPLMALAGAGIGGVVGGLGTDGFSTIFSNVKNMISGKREQPQLPGQVTQYTRQQYASYTQTHPIPLHTPNTPGGGDLGRGAS